MNKFIETVRLLALALIFGGAIAVVFVAVTQVRIAKADGVDVAVAAFNNAPLFIHYSKLALGAGIILLVAEVADFFTTKVKSKCDLARYACSSLSAGLVLFFALSVVPPMSDLLPKIKTDEAAHAEFTKLHKISQPVLGIAVFLAMASLALSTGKSKKLSAE